MAFIEAGYRSKALTMVKVRACLSALCLLFTGCAGAPGSFSQLALPIDWANISTPTDAAPKVTLQDQAITPETVDQATDPNASGQSILALKEQQAAHQTPLFRQLYTMTEPEIAQMLGNPRRKLHQDAIIVWQYVTPQCQWDLYFRANDGNQPQKLHDLIVHRQGQIVTDAQHIDACTLALRQLG